MMRRFLQFACALLLLAGNAGCGSDEGPQGENSDTANQRDVRLREGTAVLELYAESQRRLERLGLRVTPTGAASRVGDRPAFTFPVRGGVLSQPSLIGMIELGGGLRFSSDAGETVFTDLTVTTVRNGVLATVHGKRSLMFNLEQPSLRQISSGVVAGTYGMELYRFGAIAVEAGTGAQVVPGGNLGQLEVRALPDGQLPG